MAKGRRKIGLIVAASALLVGAGALLFFKRKKSAIAGGEYRVKRLSPSMMVGVQVAAFPDPATGNPTVYREGDPQTLLDLANGTLAYGDVIEMADGRGYGRIEKL